MSNAFEDIIDGPYYKTIQDYGKDVLIIYGDTATCNSCGYDPINKEATNPSCATCGGQYYYQTESDFYVKGVLRIFVTNMGYSDFTLQNFGFVPDHDARLTCWLGDVLINESSATGVSYLDKSKNIRVEIDSKKYTVRSTSRVGLGKPKILIATLKELK